MFTRTNRIVGLTLGAALLVSACGGGADDDARNDRPAVEAEASRDAAANGASDPSLASPDPSPSDAADDSSVVVARASGDLTIYSDTAGTVHTVLPAQTDFGSPRTLLVAADHGEWLDVVLPTRPNGSRAWIRSADVQQQRVQHHVTVDTASRTLTVTVDGAVVLESPVAVGSAENPTPTGTHYVTDLLDTQSDGGAYGPFALGTSAHSDTLTEFAGGDGQVGIHGTNDASSIGQAVSHGCVRVPNDVIVELAHMLPLGTPVTIV